MNASENHAHHNWIERDGWWFCTECERMPTRVKPGKPRQDRPLNTVCPGPILFVEEHLQDLDQLPEKRGVSLAPQKDPTN